MSDHLSPTARALEVADVTLAPDALRDVTVRKAGARVSHEACSFRRLGLTGKETHRCRVYLRGLRLLILGSWEL